MLVSCVLGIRSSLASSLGIGYMDMASLHACASGCRNVTVCRLPSIDSLSSSLSSWSTVSFTSSSSYFSSAVRSSRIHYSHKQIYTAAALLPNLEYYEIPSSEGIPVGNKLKLYNLPPGCSHDALIEHFRSCGAVVESLEITENTEEGNASGVIDLGDLDQACAAVAQLDGVAFQGKPLRMDFVERRPYEKQNLRRSYPKKITAVPENKVYVGNIPFEINNARLEEIFSVHGTVQKAEIMMNRLTGRSRGFGFVTLAKAEEVAKVISALDGHEVEGRTLKVKMAVHQTSDELVRKMPA
ncbi:hypothetical protein KP509_11G072200 [Ceratopteris richardii]|uniref:RRM domain-containing protein n=1 Tax=Ceratopteris richardii TaxID=49495 RepID=A0A8T2TW32_CERRI|nr:hypothetical protein KP509_11G072200 [Ceratopteris richardii]